MGRWRGGREDGGLGRGLKEAAGDRAMVEVEPRAGAWGLAAQLGAGVVSGATSGVSPGPELFRTWDFPLTPQPSDLLIFLSISRLD